MSHSIRLRDPWQVSVLSQDLPTNAAPCTLQFTRKFNQPTGLVAGQTVKLFLKLTPTTSLVGGWLNASELIFTAEDGGLMAELQSHLQAFNNLTLSLQCASSPPNLFSGCAAAELRL